MPSTGVTTARLMLATVVLGTIATTSTVALTLPDRPAADVDIPEFPDAPPAPLATPAAAPATGADIAALVLARAEYETFPDPDDAIWDVLAERLRESVGEPVCGRV